MTRGLQQLDPLHGEWVTESKKYSKGRGHTTVAPTAPTALQPALIGKFGDGGNTIAGAWELSEHGTSWKVDFDLTCSKDRG